MDLIREIVVYQRKALSRLLKKARQQRYYAKKKASKISNVVNRDAEKEISATI